MIRHISSFLTSLQSAPIDVSADLHLQVSPSSHATLRLAEIPKYTYTLWSRVIFLTEHFSNPWSSPRGCSTKLCTELICLLLLILSEWLKDEPSCERIPNMSNTLYKNKRMFKFSWFVNFDWLKIHTIWFLLSWGMQLTSVTKVINKYEINSLT